MRRLVLLSLLGLAACATAPRGPGASSSATASTAPAARAPTAFQVSVHGHGQPMILIPGYASSGHVWDDVVAHEQDRFECHVLTVAGFAGVPASDDRPKLTAIREQLAQYIQDHHLQHPVVVGHSLGGVLALELAAHHPDLVGKLVIVDSLPFLPAAMNPDITPTQAAMNAGRMRQMIASQPLDQRRAYEEQTLPTMISDPDKVQVALDWVMHSDAETLGDTLYELMTTDVRPELSKIHAPTLVIATWHGMPGETRDDVVGTFQQQYRALSGVQLAVADRARHFVMWDDPTWFDAQLDGFLTGAPGVASR